MRHIPNILSIIRLLLVGVFVYFFENAQYIAALSTYVLAVVTDLLDGYLARRNNWISNVGKVLDPLADKLMLIAALVCFYLHGFIPLFILIIVVVKELSMIIGGMFLYKRNVVVYADWFGKAAAGFFNVGVVATICKNFWPWIGIWNFVLLSVAIVLAIIALIHYGKRNLPKGFAKKEKALPNQDASKTEE